MEREELFKFVQKHMKNVPLMLIGSGGSAPCGLPGMSELGAFLISRITPKYSGVSSWDDFCSNLEEGQDLETALSSIALSPELLDDIKIETWNLVSKRDLALFSQIVLGNIQLSLTSLLKKLYQTHPQCLNIITTNYDRVIEYACDLARLKVNTGFEGCYLKRYAGAFAAKTVVNLIKVHGSLDVFRDAHDSAFSVVMQQEIPIGLVPEIITPGLSKFQAILRGTSRQLLTESDRLINQAQSFLAIGYGFND